MRNPIRRNDIFRSTILIPAARMIPAELITSNPVYTGLVQSMPDWMLPASLGFALAVWAVDPFTNDSRLLQLRGWLFDRFRVHALTVGEPLSAAGDILSVDITLRFRKVTKGHLWLRVYSCTGMARPPLEFVVDLGVVDQPKGGKLHYEVARLLITHPGCDPEQTQGWIGGESLVGNSQNIAYLELRGAFPTQVYRFFVARSDYAGQQAKPGLFVIGEDEDIFDGNRNIRF